jgi:hypothetical protein
VRCFHKAFYRSNAQIPDPVKTQRCQSIQLDIGNVIPRRPIAQSATDATAHRNKARVKPTSKTTMVLLAMPAFLLRFIAGCPERFSSASPF